MNRVIGTAGHIDHGKSSLVHALTGVDPDRLKEEKARGITIELGFARLALPSGESVSVVDVPGHEKFVGTMLAGAHGIYDTHPLQRMFRDSHAASAHINFNADIQLAPWSLLVLGGDYQSPTM